jgi:Fe-S-cluster containining protein
MTGEREMTKRARKSAGKAAPPAGLSRRVAALMADDLGGAVSFNALAFVKASLQGAIAARAAAAPAQGQGAFKAVKSAAERGDMALEIAGRSVAETPIDDILAAHGTPAACAAGCAFCCVLTPDGNGGPITEAEAARMYPALAALRGAPDGRDWHAHACAALDPETRMCRAYETRPVLCRATASADAATCEALAGGDESRGTNARHAAAYMLHVAQALNRRSLGAEAPTYALARFTAAVIDGAELDAALRAARHGPAETRAVTEDAIAAFAQATRNA